MTEESNFKRTNSQSVKDQASEPSVTLDDMVASTGEKVSLMVLEKLEEMANHHLAISRIGNCLSERFADCFRTLESLRHAISSNTNIETVNQSPHPSTRHDDFLEQDRLDDISDHENNNHASYKDVR